MSRTISIMSWRRVLMVAITALIAALAVSFSAPGDARAFMDPSVVRSGTTGWVQVRHQAVACPAIYPTPAWCSQGRSITAWRWSGSSWSQSSLAGGTQVYAYPYSAPWHWVWTQRTGWLAVKSSDLTTGRTCPPGAFC
jgi:hypothetical protein